MTGDGRGGDPKGWFAPMSEILKNTWLQNWFDWRGRQHSRLARRQTPSRRQWSLVSL